MFRIRKITGTITVHDLDNLTFKYAVKGGQFLLLGDINLSDRMHEMAAHIISRELERLVIWQDICGNKNFVHPSEILSEKNSSMFDPRDNLQLGKAYIC